MPEDGGRGWQDRKAAPDMQPVWSILTQAATAIDRLDAEVLLADQLGQPRLSMLARPEQLADAAEFMLRLARRMRHEPVAYITGAREFWSLPIRVTPDVLVPRPDSETLIAEALAHFAARPPANILDLGTGSGALLLAALSEWPKAEGLGVDCLAAALAVAQGNAEALGLAGRARFQLGDWAQGVEGPFDLLLCNPPYIPDGTALMPDVAAFEPAGALFGGADGLDPYRRLLPDVPRLLSPGGVALFEFGVGQAEALLELATGAGLSARIVDDLAGRPRVLVATLSKLLVKPGGSV